MGEVRSIPAKGMGLDGTATLRCWNVASRQWKTCCRRWDRTVLVLFVIHRYIHTFQLRSDGVAQELTEDPPTQSCPSATTRSAPRTPDALPSYTSIRPSRLCYPDLDQSWDLDSSDDDSQEGWTAVGDGSRYHGKSSHNFLIRTIAGYKADRMNQPWTWSESGSSTPAYHGNTARLPSTSLRHAPDAFTSLSYVGCHLQQASIR